MKLHDLRPAPGSHTARTRVGRGIAAGKGKTAGRGTKGQKARAGGSIPPWFEGGQTPLHMRIPKLRGFKNRFRTPYEVVNLGDIARLVALGTFESGEMPKAPKGTSAAPITVNQELLRDAGLVRRLDRPLKVLGGGAADVSTPLFVVADRFSRTARARIEEAGGSVSVLEVPTEKRPALGVDAPPRRRRPAADDDEETATPAAEPAESAKASEAAPAGGPKPAKRARAQKTAPIADGTGDAARSDEAPPAPEAKGTDEAGSGSADR